jgi:hypothetical protein
MSEALEIKAEVACQECGQYGAMEIGEGQYCQESYMEMGSSCGGGAQSAESGE